MKIRAAIGFLIVLTCPWNPHGAGEELIQSPVRSWGQPAFGLRTSISVEKVPALTGGSFAVSAIVENISGARADLQAMAAFDLSSSSITSPESKGAFGSYWCPVSLTYRNAAGKSGLILASPSRLVVEKNSSVSATFDLTRHGWDKITSSWWPARDFASVVVPGQYTLRLDIQVGSGEDPKWIRSNEIKIAIGK